MIGVNHEQQHQELLLMDLLDGFSRSPLEPAYALIAPNYRIGSPSSPPPLGWWRHPGGLVELGHQGNGFHFDNESPAHRVWLEPFAIGDRLVTNGEYAAFMADGGYQDSRHWMDEGWHWRHHQHITAPQYWRKDHQGWQWEFTLEGRCPLDSNAPVRHLSMVRSRCLCTLGRCSLATRGRVGNHGLPCTMLRRSMAGFPASQAPSR